MADNSSKKLGTFHLHQPGVKDDPVIDSLPVGDDEHRVLGLRINRNGVVLLSFMNRYYPGIDTKAGGELIPAATVRFNGEDRTHIVTEICLSLECITALKILLNRHVEPMFTPLKRVESRPSPLGM